MKRFLLTLAAALMSAVSALAQPPSANAFRFDQRDPTNTVYYTRVIAPPNYLTASSVLLYDLNTQLPVLGLLAGMTWDGTTLTAVGTQADWLASSGAAQILNRPTLATVATSGSYTDLANTPSFAAVALSGSYTDLSGRPTLAAVATSGAYADLSGKPVLATVATTGAYSSLSGTPALAAVATTGAYSSLTGTPTLAAVATTGAYSSLTGTPALATVATTGSYTDLTNKPTIPVINARVFSYPTRALATCFQISSTRDAQVSYLVDVTTTLTLASGAQGTVSLRTYTNATCTTGGQTVVSGTSGLPATLSVTVGLQNLGTVALPGVIPAGSYVQIESASNSGTPTFTARQGQEVLL